MDFWREQQDGSEGGEDYMGCFLKVFTKREYLGKKGKQIVGVTFWLTDAQFKFKRLASEGKIEEGGRKQSSRWVAERRQDQQKRRKNCDSVWCPRNSGHNNAL